MKSSILPFLILQFTIPFIQAKDRVPKFQYFTPRPNTFEVQQNEKLSKITQEKGDNPDLIIPKLSDILAVLPSTCPVPEENPTDCVNDCWSPGAHDVDCPTGKFSL